MTSQPWIHDFTLVDVQYDWDLQWSHDLSAMDTANCGRPARPGKQTFNGAMTLRPWIQ